MYSFIQLWEKEKGGARRKKVVLLSEIGVNSSPPACDLVAEEQQQTSGVISLLNLLFYLAACYLPTHLLQSPSAAPPFSSLGAVVYGSTSD